MILWLILFFILHLNIKSLHKHTETNLAIANYEHCMKNWRNHTNITNTDRSTKNDRLKRYEEEKKIEIVDFAWNDIWIETKRNVIDKSLYSGFWIKFVLELFRELFVICHQLIDFFENFTFFFIRRANFFSNWS